ncbi:MAG: aminomethyl-transferring glycine dehydrogenase, partial [Pseudomonadota bacterium]
MRNRDVFDLLILRAIAIASAAAVASSRSEAFADDASENDVGEIFGGIIQYPSTEGGVTDPTARIRAIQEMGGFAIVATDLLALCLIASPGELGADIAIGSTQRFGVPMGFGGPHAAFFATRNEHRRTMPGRLIGVTVDKFGNTAYRMSLQTREQHIRREKATSNICTAQVLLAVIAGLYAVYHGADGLKRRAEGVHRLACILAAGLVRAGFTIKHKQFFDTVTIIASNQACSIVERARHNDIELRLIDKDHLSIALDETTSLQDVYDLLAVFSERHWTTTDLLDRNTSNLFRLPAGLIRASAFLEHPVFHQHRSETELMRYLRRLQAKDIALDRSMIPLGSCTMKLNAAAEMSALSWPEFSDMHPFLPLKCAAGYLKIIKDLETWLAEITGYDAISIQPNAGSQGEYAGLLAIRAYHQDRGQRHRDICLIPSSAHGTNPASATMAGMRVFVVGCDQKGDIDIQDLTRKVELHADELAALMVTYPSTHGVFEREIRRVCEIVHEAGGQVYLDGANLNAMMGLCRPGEIGADVSHINLHKTFCIPHGGGGPGMGPIGVKAHLAPYLPDHPVVQINSESTRGQSLGTIASAPWGSPLILPISWAYISMMGADGLTRSSLIAILNANYVAQRLKEHFPIVFEGAGGFVAHECII